MGKESSHYEETPSPWTFAKDYLPGQRETTSQATGVNGDLRHWFWWLRHNNIGVNSTFVD